MLAALNLEINAGVPANFQPLDVVRFETALRRFDEENSHDPNKITVEGDVASLVRARQTISSADSSAALSRVQPRELVYAHWVTDWVLRLCPDASETLRLAARCQHLCRWEIPRNGYPMTKPGYLQWRAELKKFHARKSGEILREAGYNDETIQHVQDLNLKKNFPNDPEVCVLEDALCLVFLEHQFADLAAKTDDEKMINALQKSWKKMTPTAHAEALKLNYGPREKDLLEQALGAKK